MVDNLLLKTSTNIVTNQLGRYVSSVGANYRASLRARGNKKYVSKLNMVLEETVESFFD